MTEKDIFTLDNPIMFDKKNGRCRCIPIPYEKDMTEKRFTGEFDKQYSGVHDNGEQLTNFEVVDLLNNLSEEKEQLKLTINTLTHDNTKMKKVLNPTKKENEQIKQVIKEAYNNERTQIGKNTLKQLMETIQ